MAINLLQVSNNVPVISMFTGVFSYVTSICGSPVNTRYVVSDVANEIDVLLYDVKKMMEEQVCMESDLALALFAVCAWVDEKILNMPSTKNFSMANEWKVCLLQTRYFNTLNAGYEFFEKLNSLESTDEGSLPEGSVHDDDNVREVFYTCLALGYRGRYIDVNDEILLDNLKQANYLHLKRNAMFKLKKNNKDYIDNAIESNKNYCKNNLEFYIEKYIYLVFLSSTFFVYFFYCIISVILDIRLGNVLKVIQLW